MELRGQGALMPPAKQKGCSAHHQTQEATRAGASSSKSSPLGSAVTQGFPESSTCLKQPWTWVQPWGCLPCGGGTWGDREEVGIETEK